MMIKFTNPIKNCSPCGALVYAAMPSLYQILARYEEQGRIFNEFPVYARQLVSKLQELTRVSTGMEYKISSNADANTPKSIHDGWLTVDVWAKPEKGLDCYVSRFRMRRVDVLEVEVDMIALTEEV